MTDLATDDVDLVIAPGDFGVGYAAMLEQFHPSEAVQLSALSVLPKLVR